MARTSGRLSRVIARIKERIQRSPALYRALFALITAHRQGLAQRLRRGQYHSRHGGTWIYRRDFRARAARKVKAGELEAHELEQLEHFAEQGFVILRARLPRMPSTAASRT